MAKSDVRQELERLNEKCADFCREYAADVKNRDKKWKALGPQRTPNFRLLYSSPETFATRDRVMILGTNPGGNHRNADTLDPWEPFQRDPEYSAYIDDRWPKPQSTTLMEPGTHRIQKAVRNLAAALQDDPAKRGDALLRQLPCGNMIPFRSENFSLLPSSVRYAGLEFAWELIRIARPRGLILLSSNCSLWDPLIETFAQGAKTWVKELRPKANRPFREAVAQGRGARPKFIWALPAFNTGRAGQKPIERLLMRMQDRSVRIANNGRVRVRKR